ncbi:hypothetical protein RI129_001268 [Pyrocoelia pectoralis]|uniref:CCHC-type domain-containing protein n=1 Tax=Pyrocoelia pectoralis TaxID=417401 RepID=A0AAN7VXL5_9COLE
MGKRHPEFKKTIGKVQTFKGGMTTFRKYVATIEEGEEEEKEARDRYLFLANAEGSNDKERAQSCHETIRKAAKKLLGARHHKVNIFTNPSTREWVRKLTECVFYPMGLTYYMEDRKARDKTDPTPRKEGGKGMVTITMKDQNKSYADLLKGARSALAGGDRESLKASSKTKDGSLRLVIDPKRVEVNAFRGKLEAELGKDVDLRVRKPQATYYIRDIDEITTKDEIQQALTTTVGNTPEGWAEVSEVRVAANGRRTATIWATKEKEAAMDDLAFLWVGITKCPIRRRVELNRCAKCWGVHGKTDKCASRDVQGKCLNCGGDGHFKDKCTNEKRCAICELDGHAPWTIACPQYKAAIRAAENGRKPSRLVNRVVDTPKKG